MKRNVLLWLLGALVVLIGLAYAAGVFDRDASTVRVPAVDVPADDLSRVRITRPGLTLALERQGTAWRLTEPLQAGADSVTVAQLLRDLGGLELEAVVTSNPDRYAAYGIDSTGTTITAAWPSGEQQLVVGNQGPDYQAVYVRLDDDPRVFVTRTRLAVPDALDRWRDKTLLSLSPAAVTAVSVQTPDGTYDLAGAGSAWTLTQDGTATPADSAAVAGWLQRFAPLKADGFMDEPPAAIVRADPTHRVRFTTTDGTTETLSIMSWNDNYAATTDTGDVTYQLRTFRLDTLLPDPATLK